MKRILILLTAVMLLLSGCSAGQRLKEPVTFYYVLEDFQFGQEPGVFVAEEREASGHRNDLTYLLSLYLMGPSEDGHVSRLPRGTQVETVEQTKLGLSLTLSDVSSITDSAFTQACACLTLTCLDLTDAQAVTIRSGTRSVTMSRDTLFLSDNSLTEEANIQ